MLVQVQRTRPLQRYFTIAALAVTPIVIAGLAPLYTLRLLHRDPFLPPRVQVHGLVMASWIALLLVILGVLRIHVHLSARRAGRDCR